MRLMERAAVRYAVAIAISVAALYGRALLTPLIGRENPYHTVWVAVVLCSWYCGLGPSILSSLVCALGVEYYFLTPAHSFLVADRAASFGLICFYAFSVAIIAFGEANRRAAQARKLAEGKLQGAKTDLEREAVERIAGLQKKNERLQKQAALVRALSARLLTLQDEERRRIARELHDSVGQALSAMSMNVCRVWREKDKLSAEAQKCLEENNVMVAQTAAEIRTLSHLLHPPLLDEAGLESALYWLVDGFKERSNIQAELEVPQPFERLNRDLELAIFRVVQECLTNIHRHSGSQTARIFLSQDDGAVHCEISDEGRGIPEEKQAVLKSAGLAGVGLRGMRERVNQLGGTLEVYSTSRGTTVSVDLPIRLSETEEVPQRTNTATSAMGAG